MLTITTRDPRGYAIDVRWLCGACESAELEGRGIKPLKVFHIPVTVSLGRYGSEQLVHTDEPLPEYCDCHGCGPVLVDCGHDATPQQQ